MVDPPLGDGLLCKKRRDRASGRAGHLGGGITFALYINRFHLVQNYHSRGQWVQSQVGQIGLFVAGKQFSKTIEPGMVQLNHPSANLEGWIVLDQAFFLASWPDAGNEAVGFHSCFFARICCIKAKIWNAIPASQHVPLANARQALQGHRIRPDRVSRYSETH